MEYKLNTSNPGKLKEFQELFAAYGHTLKSTHFDLDEVEADPLTVIAHKASQLPERVLVDDTSLEIEGAEVGINVRWLLEHLKDYTGRPAIWKVLLAYQDRGEVIIYQGLVPGTITASRGSDGFGFDPFFQPLGTDKTLAEEKPNHLNARAIAVSHLMSGQVYLKRPTLKEWSGPWQK